MTTATAELTEFVLARIAERKAAALAATPGPWFALEDAVSASPEERDEWGDLMGNAGPHVMHASFEGNGPANAAHIALHDPARVLAECEAKRRIVKLHTEEATDDPPDGGVGCVVCDETNYSDGGRYSSGWPCDTLRALAAVYADHEDFRKEWVL